GAPYKNQPQTYAANSMPRVDACSPALPHSNVMTGAHSGSRLTHAGGGGRRKKNGATLVLLVRAKPAPHDWVLPKGHIEKGESPDEAAVREVREEAGVEATVVRYAGLIEFDSPKGEHVRAGYFLMEFVKD